MTIEQIADTLPNGFHDCFLIRFMFDVAENRGWIDLDLDFDDPDPEKFRTKRLVLNGLALFVVEPPSTTITLGCKKRLWADGYVTDDKIFTKLSVYSQIIPKNCFIYSLFIHDWNNFIHIAASDAELIDV